MRLVARSRRKRPTMEARVLLAFFVPVVMATACNSSGNSVQATATANAPLQLQQDCDPIVPSHCGFPYPSNVWTTPDSTRVTGMHVYFGDTTLPTYDAGRRSHRQDAVHRTRRLLARWRHHDEPSRRDGDGSGGRVPHRPVAGGDVADHPHGVRHRRARPALGRARLAVVDALVRLEQRRGRADVLHPSSAASQGQHAVPRRDPQRRRRQRDAASAQPGLPGTARQLGQQRSLGRAAACALRRHPRQALVGGRGHVVAAARVGLHDRQPAGHDAVDGPHARRRAGEGRRAPVRSTRTRSARRPPRGRATPRAGSPTTPTRTSAVASSGR